MDVSQLADNFSQQKLKPAFNLNLKGTIFSQTFYNSPKEKFFESTLLKVLTHLDQIHTIMRMLTKKTAVNINP